MKSLIKSLADSITGRTARESDNMYHYYRAEFGRCEGERLHNDWKMRNGQY